MSNFTERAHERLADPERRRAIGVITDRQSDERAKRPAELPDLQAMRDRGPTIRDEAIQNLPRYLDELRRKLERTA